MKAVNKNTWMVLADQAVFSGTSFLTTMAVAKYFSIKDFGIYSAYMLVFYLIISIISAWTTQVYQVEKERTVPYKSFVFWTHGVLACVLCALVVAGREISVIEVSNPVIGYGFGLVMYDFGRKLLLADEQVFKTLLLDILVSVSTVLAFILFLNLTDKDIHALIVYLNGAYAFVIVVMVWVIKPFYFDVPAWKNFLKNHVQKGGWLFLTSLSQWWAGNLFVVSSGLYLGSAALGALRLGQSLMGVLNVVLQAFENYVLPKTAKLFQTDVMAGIYYVKNTTKKLIFFVLPLLIVLFVFSDVIMVWAGNTSYLAYGYVLKGVVVLYVFVVGGQPVRCVLRSMQLNEHFFYGYLLSLCFALAASKSLIFTFGLQGVIAGLIISQGILLIYWSGVLYFKNINIWKLSTSF